MYTVLSSPHCVCFYSGASRKPDPSWVTYKHSFKQHSREPLSSGNLRLGQHKKLISKEGWGSSTIHFKALGVLRLSKLDVGDWGSEMTSWEAVLPSLLRILRKIYECKPTEPAENADVLDLTSGLGFRQASTLSLSLSLSGFLSLSLSLPLSLECRQASKSGVRRGRGVIHESCSTI